MMSLGKLNLWRRVIRDEDLHVGFLFLGATENFERKLILKRLRDLPHGFGGSIILACGSFWRKVAIVVHVN